ncbi:DDE-type integrase/transposase/recombinase [Lacticaseibacillus sp. N501-2]|uniref:DDE-type integrase/transposase/recombinase n=1 Tax=Lacticaseibacillus salsurae TaxID=3367729 RepID=UPI0038B3EDE3
MEIEQQEDIALFRYNLIHPIVSNNVQPDGSKAAYMARIAATELVLPNGKRGHVGVGTLKQWATDYRKHGLRGLKPKPRKDAGSYRKLSDEQKDEILRLKSEGPNRPATVIRKRMMMTGYFAQGAPSDTTIQRFLAQLPAEIKNAHTEDMRAFEMDHVNELWQIDTTHGPFILDGGHKRKVYIVGIIDDASRYLVGWGMYFEDNAVNVQMTLKQAIATYGKPRQLYADNGKPYVNKQLALICADLGIGIRHAAVYHGNQKGKIERWFGVMKKQWMADINYDEFELLEALRANFAEYVRDRNNQANRSLGTNVTPVDRFSLEPEAIHRVSRTVLNTAFLHRVERKVAKDGTVKINGAQYETGRATIGQKVTIRHQPDLSVVYLEWENELLEIKPVNKIENAHTRRIRMTEDEG